MLGEVLAHRQESLLGVIDPRLEPVAPFADAGMIAAVSQSPSPRPDPAHLERGLGKLADRLDGEVWIARDVFAIRGGEEPSDAGILLQEAIDSIRRADGTPADDSDGIAMGVNPVAFTRVLQLLGSVGRDGVQDLDADGTG